MKKTVSAVLVILYIICSPSFVFSNTAGCSDIGAVAAQIMENRQIGVPISQIMDAIMGAIEDADSQAAYKEVVILAYEQPSYSTEEMRQSMVSEFRNQIELQCYKSGMK